ncbi:MAG: hypothetical protein ACP5N7_01120 [Candidatus Pacearchaeota archaeon]
MSGYEFNDPIFVKTLDTAESFIIGSYKLPTTYTGAKELNYIMVAINIENMSITNEGFKLQLHADSTGNSLLVESAISNLSEIPNISTRWNGLLRFTFPIYPLSTSIFYYMKIVPINYVRPVGGHIGLTYDWPASHTQNVSSTPYNRPIFHKVYFWNEQ